MICLEKQSPDIAHGVHEIHEAEDVGAGDQVYLSSWACFYYNSPQWDEIKTQTFVLTFGAWFILPN